MMRSKPDRLSISWPQLSWPRGDGSRPISCVADGYVPPEVTVSLDEGSVVLNLDVPLRK